MKTNDHIPSSMSSTSLSKNRNTSSASWLQVFYALLAVGCAGGGWLALQGRRPQLAGWLTAVLWLLAAFLLLFGAGSNACPY